MIRASRILVFLMGAVSLAGQVSWSRLAATVVGGTFGAWALTLFGAMAGLSMGAAWAGARSPRCRLGAILATAGLTLIAMPYAILGIGHLEGWPTLRGILVAAVLAAAHLPLGAFLPTVVASQRIQGKSLGTQAGGLYALGSLGAVVGALGAAEILPRLMGLDHLGMLLGAVTIASSALARAAQRESIPLPTVSPANGPVPSTLLLAAFVLGVLGLVTESLWMRVLGFYWESNTLCYAFVAAATVGGLSAGSWAAGRISARIGADRKGAGWVLAAAALGLGAAAAGAPLAAKAFSAAERVLTAFVLVGIPASMFGAAFVILLGIAGAGGGGARALGFLSAANSAGAAIGPLLLWAGGPWVPWPPQMLLVVAAGYAALVALISGRRTILTSLALSATMGLCAGTLAPSGPAITDFHFAARSDIPLDAVTVPFLHPSLESTVAVTRNSRTGTEVLWIDRGAQGDTSPLSRRIPERLGTLPCELLGRTPKAVMVIGLGTGITLSSIAGSGAVSVDVAELSGGVIESNRTILAEINGSVLERPGVRVHRGDGRTLLLDSAARYDLIVADMMYPTVLGAGNLFSREFYGLARRRLGPDGLFVHWVPGFLLSPEDLSSVATAFLCEFPEGSAWIGYLGPRRLVLGLVGGKVGDRVPTERLALRAPELRRLAGAALPIRDADPRLEVRSRGCGDGRFGTANLARLMETRTDSHARSWIAFARAELAGLEAEGHAPGSSDYRTLRERAAMLYGEAHALAPGTTEAEFHLAGLAFERNLEAAHRASEVGDAERVIASLKRAAANQDLCLGNLYLADALVASGRLDEAAAELRKAVAKSPRSADARMKLALIAREIGDPATAQREIEVASSLRNEHRGTGPATRGAP